MGGDVNGDGLDDVLIPVRGLDSVGAAVGPGGSNAGGAVVVFGKSTAFPAAMSISSLNGSSGFAMHGLPAGDPSQLRQPMGFGDVEQATATPTSS